MIKAPKLPKPVTPNRYGAALPKPMSAPKASGNNLGKYLHPPKGKR